VVWLKVKALSSSSSTEKIKKKKKKKEDAEQNTLTKAIRTIFKNGEKSGV
jgi:hypothetical protein